MKKLLIISAVLLFAIKGTAQFTAMPLDYPDDGTYYMSWFTSIVDENTIWVGTVHQGLSGYLPYSYAVKTTDGGYTWQFLSIPVSGTAGVQHLSAWDGNVCYYLYMDGATYQGTVWKTVDGGATWTLKTTTQFQGGWPNSIHAFSADTVVVIGDPNGGYFEIQVTYDGGDTWTRVPQADLPPPLTNEWGVQGNYYSVGNTIGFGTSHGRCIRSNDRGLHWTATQVVDEYMEFCFSDSLRGIGIRPGTNKSFFKTEDGGNTWTGMPNPSSNLLGSMSRIPGISGAFVITAADSLVPDNISVFFTPDFFNSISKIDSNIANASYINFEGPSNGWIGGSYGWYHNIHKYVGVLSSLPEPPATPGTLAISPNPAKDAAFIRVPGSCVGKKAVLYISDLTGRMICTRNYDRLPELIYQSTSGIPDGLYVIQIVLSPGDRLTTKWMISR